MVGIQMRMEPTVKHKRSRSPTVTVGASHEVIRPVVASRVEEVIAHDGVIVGIVVDRADRISGVDRHGKRRKAIFLRNHHLLLHRMIVGADALNA
jgi:hypothetical protein